MVPVAPTIRAQTIVAAPIRLCQSSHLIRLLRVRRTVPKSSFFMNGP